MGPSDKASKEATASEAKRKADVEGAQKAIEGIYSAPGRETDIRNVGDATRQYLQGDLTRQNDVAGRNLKFALARSGQTMGSTDVDQFRALAEKYLRGSVEVQRRGDAAENSLRQADQSSKLNLFSQAAAGLDATTAQRNAGESLRNNIGIAKADALQTGLGDLFSGFGDMYKRNRENRGADQAQLYQYSNAYTPNTFYSGFGSGKAPW